MGRQVRTHRDPPAKPSLTQRRVALTATFLLLFHLTGYLPVHAGQISAATDSTVEKPSDPELKLPGVTGANVTHSFLSTRVENLARKIDSFFGEDSIYEESSGTYLQTRGSVIYLRGGKFDFDGKFRAKIDLPQLTEKFNLVIESSDKKDTGEEFSRITTGTKPVDEIADAEVAATLQFIIKEKRKWNLSIRPGLKFSDPIESFVKLRFRRTQPLGKTWLSRGTVEVGFFSRQGWENEWELDLERGFGEDYFFRSTSSVLWREEFPGNQFLGQRLLLTHILDRRQSLAFEVGTSAETRPNLRDLSYFSSLRYRRDIHRGWLFLELKPQLLFARENSYRADPALVLTLEALFGARYLD
jgi:hypothetical protein